MRIWVDADACPVAIKEILFRTSKRLELPVILVANQRMEIPKSDLVKLITVPQGADVAHDKIVQLVAEGDLVVTADIPLAARVVEKNAIALGPRGEVYDDKNVHERLAARDLMEQFRSFGMETSGPPPLAKRDIQDFANGLDRTITRLRKLHSKPE